MSNVSIALHTLRLNVVPLPAHAMRVPQAIMMDAPCARLASTRMKLARLLMCHADPILILTKVPPYVSAMQAILRQQMAPARLVRQGRSKISQDQRRVTSANRVNTLTPWLH